MHSCCLAHSPHTPPNRLPGTNGSSARLTPNSQFSTRLQALRPRQPTAGRHGKPRRQSTRQSSGGSTGGRQGEAPHLRVYHSRTAVVRYGPTAVSPRRPITATPLVRATSRTYTPQTGLLSARDVVAVTWMALARCRLLHVAAYRSTVAVYCGERRLSRQSGGSARASRGSALPAHRYTYKTALSRLPSTHVPPLGPACRWSCTYPSRTGRTHGLCNTVTGCWPSRPTSGVLVPYVASPREPPSGRDDDPYCWELM